MGRLEERVIIVTGGAHGIGRAYCESLAREGARVVVADIDRQVPGPIVVPPLIGHRPAGIDRRDARVRRG